MKGTVNFEASVIGQDKLGFNSVYHHKLTESGKTCEVSFFSHPPCILSFNLNEKWIGGMILFFDKVKISCLMYVYLSSLPFTMVCCNLSVSDRSLSYTFVPLI